MLVLSRKVGERIVIGDNVTVEIVEIRGDKVRLGFTAPPEVRIDRQEVALRRAAGKTAETRRTDEPAGEEPGSLLKWEDDGGKPGDAAGTAES